MVADTALFRYPYYHTPLDTVDKIDCEMMARVVGGVRRVIEMLANEPLLANNPYYTQNPADA